MESLDLNWDQPRALYGLVLPVLLLLTAFLRQGARRLAPGTESFWRGIASTTGARPARASFRPPISLLLGCAGLTLAALALAGPERGVASPQRTWEVLVDRGPGMVLPTQGPGSPTRLEAALGRGLSVLDECAAPGDRFLWSAWGRDTWQGDLGERPPADWLLPARSGGALLPSEASDRAGVLWVTDTVPDPLPVRAGFAASGGEAVPGPVSFSGSERIDWDGESLAVATEPAAPRRVRLIRAAGSAEVPEVFERILEVWAAERAVAVVAGPVPTDGVRGAVELELLWEGTSPGDDVLLARDAWQAKGRVSRSGLSGVLDAGAVWLSAGERAVIEAVPGRIRCAVLDLQEPGGDPAAFAVSWARLFDQACLPPAGVIPLEDRRGKGSGAGRPPESPSGEGGIARNETGILRSWLSVGAALCLLGVMARVGNGLRRTRGSAG